MPIDKDNFYESGPNHMMSRGFAPMRIDWDDEEHCRCVTACLVKGTYVMQSDKTMLRANRLAPAWWKSFHFRLVRVLSDKHDSSIIFGAIFELSPQAGGHPSAPGYVVAFRGTMPGNPAAVVPDMFLNLRIGFNTVPESPRADIARRAVLELPHDRCDVWLTGHSQGASLALDVGRAMMLEHELSLPAFLYNPPHVSLAPVLNFLQIAEGAKNKAVANFIKIVASFAVTPYRERMEARFVQLAEWAPTLYVHKGDPVCQGFIDYFQQRQLVNDCFSRRGGPYAFLAARLSYRDMLFYLLGKNKERPHLLPSATLCTNNSAERSALNAHKLHQWWKPKRELMLSFDDYEYPVESWDENDQSY